jgi:hypothetical protein
MKPNGGQFRGGHSSMQEGNNEKERCTMRFICRSGGLLEFCV